MKAILFDIDGTILDSEEYTIISKVIEGRKLGYDVTREIVIKTLGMSKDYSKVLFASLFGEDFPYELMRKMRYKYILEALAKNEIKYKKGFVELFKYLKENNYKIALVSSSTHALIDNYLANFEELRSVDAIISVEDVPNGKPHPDGFLLALEKLNVKASEALVIEDSKNGILASKSASIPSVFIEDIVKLDEEIKNSATYIFDSLLDVISLLKTKE